MNVDKARLNIGGLIVAAAFTLLGAWSVGMFKGFFTGPDDVMIADPARAVADVRRLVTEQSGKPSRNRMLLEPSELPESLRLPGLRYAYVHHDHVDLILARNPDWDSGARIWSADAKRKHADEPTNYPEVYFYRYTNDAEESENNIF